MDDQEVVNAVVTFVCSYLSLIGSLLIIIAYVVARTKSTPKSAFLILHLAVSDFFWFLAGAVMSTLWVANDGSVPDELCFLIAPVINFTRMTSLVWTVVISFNVYMSVKKRKWFWKSQEADWNAYRRLYFGVAFLLAAPGTIAMIIQQHTDGDFFGGCSPGYEPLGHWILVFFFELLPIVLGFLCNCYVFFKIRRKVSKTAFPQSVRKRRKRIMYQYILICIVCWIPTIALYILEMGGLHLPILEIVARASLYISGFFNCIVFGRHDPHLRRAWDVIIFRMGLYSLCYGHDYVQANDDDDGKAYYAVHGHSLKSSDVDKMVMFQEEGLSKNADLPKDRNSIYRHRKLSKEQKRELYAERPDLDPKFKIRRAASPSVPIEEGSSHRRKKKLIIHDRHSNSSSESPNSMEVPLLDDYDVTSPNSEGVAASYPTDPSPHRYSGSVPYQGARKKAAVVGINGPKKSLDGDREMSINFHPSSSYPIGTTVPSAAIPIQGSTPFPKQNPTGGGSTSSASSSYTQSHNLSVLSDLTTISPPQNINNSYQQTTSMSMNHDDNPDMVHNPVIQQLVSAVGNTGNTTKDITASHDISYHESESDSHQSESRQSTSDLQEVMQAINFNNLNDSLALHQQDYDFGPDEGNEEYEAHIQREKERQGRNEDDASSSEDEHDAEDEDLLLSPL